MYSEKRKVLTTDIDPNLEIRLSTLTRYMQDIATEHVNKHHFGHDDLVKDNNIWVVVRMEMKINRLPVLDEEITISTHPGETKAFMFPRYFEVYDKHKNLLVSVSSIWVVTNYETRKIVLKPFGDRNLPSETSKDDLPLPEKIKNTDTADKLVDNRKARYSEMDMNGHINNTHYLDYILDTHDFEFYKKHRIVNIKINYEKEVLNNDLIELFSNNSNPEIVIGKITDRPYFYSEIQYVDR